MCGKKLFEKVLFLLLKFLAAGFLVPLILLAWTILAGRDPFTETFLSKHLLLSSVFDLSDRICHIIMAFGSLLFFTGIAFHGRSEKFRFAGYAGFCIYMFSCFLLLKMPCGIGLTMPILVIGSMVLYCAARKEPRKKLFVSGQKTASFSERFTALLILSVLMIADFFLYIGGVNFIMLFSPYRYFLLLPFAGILLPTGERLREYVMGTIWGFLFSAAVFGFFSVLPDASQMKDISIILIFLVLEYQGTLLLRGILPKIRNLSLLMLALAVILNYKIMPQVCDVNIVSVSVFILYILGDNAENIVKYVLKKIDPGKNQVERPRKEGFAAQAWSAAAFATVCLAGNDSTLPVIYLILILCCTAFLKNHFFRNAGNRTFDLLPEILIILVYSLIQCYMGVSLLPAAVISSGALALSIWEFGNLITRNDSSGRPAQALLYSAVFSLLLFLFMLLLFLHGFPGASATSMGLIFLGIFLAGERIYTRKNRSLQKDITGLGLIAAGLAAVLLPCGNLEFPSWELNGISCGVLAFLAVNLYFIIQTKQRKKEHGNG